MKIKNSVQTTESWSNGNTIIENSNLAKMSNNFDSEKLKNHEQTKFKKENKVENIEYIDTDNLFYHPRQYEIYGEIDLEPEFVASVKDMGVLTPLTVADLGNPKYGETRFTIISGHRRKAAAVITGISEVPCIIKEYESDEMMELEFLAANIQREKSDGIRLKEFISYKQILCQIGKVRKGKGVYADTLFENEAFMRFAKVHKLEDKIVPGVPLKTTEIIKKLTGFSEYEQRWLCYLEDDDFMQKKFDELFKLRLTTENGNELYDKIEIAKTAYTSGDASLHEAAKAVKDMLDDVKRQLTAVKMPKEKAEKAPKATQAKPSKPVQTLAFRVNVEIPVFDVGEGAKFQEHSSKADLYFQSEGVKLGLMRTHNQVSGFSAEFEGKVYLINPAVLADIIKKGVA